MRAPKSEIVAVNFRVPADLHGRLTRIAASTGRSLNSELITRLALSLPAEDGRRTVELLAEAARALKQEIASREAPRK